MAKTIHQVDVFISGAGPVGLVLAYHLKRMGISVFIIDSADKASPDFPMYGRACTLYPRTLELLDQLGLYEEMAQDGVSTTEGGFTYDGDGNEVDRGWRVMMRQDYGSYFKAAMNLRLKYSEDIFRARLASLGVQIHAPVKLQGLEYDAEAKDDHRTTAICVDSDGEEVRVRAKYTIGCDGGGSAVRKLAGIPFEGEKTLNHWVRIDGIVKSNIPRERRDGFGALESKTHGQILWVCLDHGATRIGYPLSDKLFQKYGPKMTQDQVVFEAKEACKPFEIELTQVDWYTVYGVQQHVAQRFQERERILIAGDAAHTHSSGAAQGMNTGIHDVVNLSWRLAGVLNGLYKPEVLANYSDERRAVAQHLIRNDHTVSSLISGKKPPHMQHREENVNVLMNEFFRKEAGFTLGLTISYPENILNDVSGSRKSIALIPGQRGPDSLLQTGGMTATWKRFLELTPFNGKFRVVVFTGQVSNTAGAIQTLRKKVDENEGHYSHVLTFLTVIAGHSIVFDEHLGVKKFGVAYWDSDENTHKRWGISTSEGALVVLRPDGMVGHVASLDDWDSVLGYFKPLVIPQEQKEVTLPRGKATRKQLGQFIAPDEKNLTIAENTEEGRTIE